MEIMGTFNKKGLPAKLVYKGSRYRLAITEEGKLWKSQIAPRLEQLFEIASDGETEDQLKKEQAHSIYRELREYFKLLGIQ